MSESGSHPWTRHIHKRTRTTQHWPSTIDYYCKLVQNDLLWREGDEDEFWFEHELSRYSIKGIDKCYTPPWRIYDPGNNNRSRATRVFEFERNPTISNSKLYWHAWHRIHRIKPTK